VTRVAAAPAPSIVHASGTWVLDPRPYSYTPAPVSTYVVTR
jgi:hypothetical protein